MNTTSSILIPNNMHVRSLSINYKKTFSLWTQQLLMLVGMREVFYFKNTIDKKIFPTKSISLEIINHVLKKMQLLSFLILSLLSHPRNIHWTKWSRWNVIFPFSLSLFFSLVNYHLANPYNLSYFSSHLFLF